MIGTILVSAVVLFVGAMVYTRTRPFDGPPKCPSCDVPYLELPQGEEHRTYDVLVCTECTNTSTVVFGTASRFAYCPTCRQRTLEMPVRRLAPMPDAPLSVEVAEHCHVCGHRDEVVLPEPGVRIGRGKVIPFPTRGR